MLSEHSSLSLLAGPQQGTGGKESISFNPNTVQPHTGLCPSLGVGLSSSAVRGLQQMTAEVLLWFQLEFTTKCPTEPSPTLSLSYMANGTEAGPRTSCENQDHVSP